MWHIMKAQHVAVINTDKSSSEVTLHLLVQSGEISLPDCNSVIVIICLFICSHIARRRSTGLLSDCINIIMYRQIKWYDVKHHVWKSHSDMVMYLRGAAIDVWYIWANVD